MITTKSDKNASSPQPQMRLSLKYELSKKFFSLKYKIRHIDPNWEKLAIKLFVYLAFLSIVIGLSVFAIFLIKLSKDYTISGDNILLDKTGQVGDFIGGVVGAIWALTGVLLFYAALRLQSKELAENRKHFQMSRLTEIIYKQLDLFNSHILNLSLKDIERNEEGNHIQYKGRSALNLIRKRVENIKVMNKAKDEQEKHNLMIQFMADSFAFVELNKNEFESFYEELNNQISVLRSVLIKDDIPPADLNELKSLFLRNIGREFLNASSLLGQFLDWYITYKKNKGEPLDLLYSPEHSIKLNISVIEEFRKTQYDKKTIKDYLRHRDMYNMTSF